MLTVDSVVQFFPRGGSAYVVRYVAHEMAARGVTPRILCGTLGGPGELSHAGAFYAGLPVEAMDCSAAAAAYRRGEPSMDGQPAPFHPSYEDRPNRSATCSPPHPTWASSASASPTKLAQPSAATGTRSTSA